MEGGETDWTVWCVSFGWNIGCVYSSCDGFRCAGAHVTLKEPKYRAVVESQLYGMLGAFAVETHEDLLLLQQLLDRHDM